MTSTEGESFAFRTVVPVDGAVETWMTGVEAEMRRTLLSVMKEGELWLAPDALEPCRGGIQEMSAYHTTADALQWLLFAGNPATTMAPLAWGVS